MYRNLIPSSSSAASSPPPRPSYSFTANLSSLPLASSVRATSPLRLTDPNARSSYSPPITKNNNNSNFNNNTTTYRNRNRNNNNNNINNRNNFRRPPPHIRADSVSSPPSRPLSPYPHFTDDPISPVVSQLVPPHLNVNNESSTAPFPSPRGNLSSSSSSSIVLPYASMNYQTAALGGIALESVLNHIKMCVSYPVDKEIADSIPSPEKYIGIINDISSRFKNPVLSHQRLAYHKYEEMKKEAMAIFSTDPKQMHFFNSIRARCTESELWRILSPPVIFTSFDSLFVRAKALLLTLKKCISIKIPQHQRHRAAMWQPTEIVFDNTHDEAYAQTHRPHFYGPTFSYIRDSIMAQDENGSYGKTVYRITLAEKLLFLLVLLWPNGDQNALITYMRHGHKINLNMDKSSTIQELEINLTEAEEKKDTIESARIDVELQAKKQEPDLDERDKPIIFNPYLQHFISILYRLDQNVPVGVTPTDWLPLVSSPMVEELRMFDPLVSISGIIAACQRHPGVILDDLSEAETETENNDSMIEEKINDMIISSSNNIGAKRKASDGGDARKWACSKEHAFVFIFSVIWEATRKHGYVDESIRLSLTKRVLVVVYTMLRDKKEFISSNKEELLSFLRGSAQQINIVPTTIEFDEGKNQVKYTSHPIPGVQKKFDSWVEQMYNLSSWFSTLVQNNIPLNESVDQIRRILSIEGNSDFFRVFNSSRKILTFIPFINNRENRKMAAYDNSGSGMNLSDVITLSASTIMNKNAFLSCIGSYTSSVTADLALHLWLDTVTVHEEEAYKNNWYCPGVMVIPGINSIAFWYGFIQPQHYILDAVTCNVTHDIDVAKSSWQAVYYSIVHQNGEWNDFESDQHYHRNSRDVHDGIHSRGFATAVYFDLWRIYCTNILSVTSHFMDSQCGVANGGVYSFSPGTEQDYLANGTVSIKNGFATAISMIGLLLRDSALSSGGITDYSLDSENRIYFAPIATPLDIVNAMILKLFRSLEQNEMVKSLYKDPSHNNFVRQTLNMYLFDVFTNESMRTITSNFAGATGGIQSVFNNYDIQSYAAHAWCILTMALTGSEFDYGQGTNYDFYFAVPKYLLTFINDAFASCEVTKETKLVADTKFELIEESKTESQQTGRLFFINEECKWILPPNYVVLNHADLFSIAALIKSECYTYDLTNEQKKERLKKMIGITSSISVCLPMSYNTFAKAFGTNVHNPSPILVSRNKRSWDPTPEALRLNELLASYTSPVERDRYPLVNPELVKDSSVAAIAPYINFIFAICGFYGNNNTIELIGKKALDGYIGGFPGFIKTNESLNPITDLFINNYPAIRNGDPVSQLLPSLLNKFEDELLLCNRSSELNDPKFFESLFEASCTVTERLARISTVELKAYESQAKKNKKK